MQLFSVRVVERCPPTTGMWKACLAYKPRSSVSSGPCSFEKKHGSTWDTRVVRRARLPRKEVIQPHLPVRLPCYDFTPITDPTLDACLSCELARRLQVLPTFVV